RNDLPTPYRRYAMGPVCRNEKPGPGRFRQFYQCDADTVGAASVAADAEICAMLADALEEVGIPRGDYVVRVNNRKVLNGVMEVAGILDPNDPEKFAHERGIVLRAIDKFDRLGPEGVRALLGAGRKDESGDFTKGAGLSEEQAEAVMEFVDARSRVEALLDRHSELSAGLGPKMYSGAKVGAQTQHFDPAGNLLDALEFSVWNGAVIEHLGGIVKGSEIGLDGVKE